MIGLRRNIRETDFGRVCDESLLRDAMRDYDPEQLDKEGNPKPPDFHPKLSEAEFLVDQLLAHGLVDGDAVVAIRKQFEYMVRNAKVRPGEEPKLTTKLVYEEIRGRALRGVDGLLSPGAEALDLEYDRKAGAVTFKWNSYEEWLTNSWQMRVLAKASAETEG